jgi:heptosyltransferase-2
VRDGPDAGSLRRVLLRLPNWLGDVVMAAPSVAALARAALQAEFVACAKPSAGPLAALLPGVARTISPARGRGLVGARREARALRAEGFDAAVVFPRSTRAVLPTAFARIPVRVGFSSEGRALWLTHPVRGFRRLRLAHRSAYYGALLRPFGLEPGGPWRLDPPEDAKAWAGAFLAESPARRAGARLVAFEAAAAYGPAKRWPAASFSTLARALREDGVDVVVVGTEDTRPVEDEIAALVPVVRAAGRTDLVRLAALLARADAVVANDTGPMHLAAAVGTPVVALFGATDPEISGPRGAPATVLRNLVPCAPCFLRECPVPGHPCLAGIAPERARAAVLDALAAPRAAATFAASPPDRSPR